MTGSLIRNGSFERGDLEFWTQGTAHIFVISSTEHFSGLYSAKIESTGAGVQSAYSSDMIDVLPRSLLSMRCAMKGTVGLVMHVVAYYFDSDYVQVGSETLILPTLTADWVAYNAYPSIPLGSYYMRLEFWFTSGAPGNHVYLDSVSMHKVTMDELVYFVAEEWEIENAVASGDTSDDLRELYGYRDYYAEVDCTSLTGTTPTLDIEICETDQYDNERVLGEFTQLAAVGDQRVGIAAPIGKGMYIKYTEGGTWTDCDFKVSIIGVR